MTISRDVVYVAGNFNGWCANCNALEDPDGDFAHAGGTPISNVVNGWGGAVSQPSLGIDFNPCDEWTNYGVSVDQDEHVYNCWLQMILDGDGSVGERATVTLTMMVWWPSQTSCSCWVHSEKPALDSMTLHEKGRPFRSALHCVRWDVDH